jgi:hypothetical protein
MPTLVGIQWDITYTPVFSTVTTMKVSGRETRRAKMFSPLWSIELKYDRLRSDSLAELQSLVGFIESIGSMTTPFLFTPPGALGAYISAPLGTGDGVTTSFIVQRSIAGYLDTVQAFTSITGVYVNGTPTVAYTTSILPLTVVFTTAPANGAVLTISYSAAHLVRLASPTTKLEQITSILWQLGSLMLESVRS